MSDALVLQQLEVHIGDRPLVRGVDLRVDAGEFVALVGPSGSGKTLTARSLLGLVDLDPGVVEGSLEVHCCGRTLRPYEGIVGAKSMRTRRARHARRTRERAFAGIRGDIIGYLPQDAPAALDPMQTVGRQVSRAAALAVGEVDPLPWLLQAGLPAGDLPRIAAAFPHALSGGMAQRVVLAQTLARGSRFVVADEPTTGLDSIVRAQLLDELRRLVDAGLGLLLITHDLRLLTGRADRVLFMNDGQIAESLDPAGLQAGMATSEAGRRLLAATRRVSVGGLI